MNQKRTIIGACDYAIETLQTLKKDLQNPDAANSATSWAIGGLVSALTSNLLQTCYKVITESAEHGDSNARNDLQMIKEKFGQFIDNMVNHE